MSELAPIDWSRFAAWEPGTCDCVCGHIFRSHAKFADGGLWSQQPCPKCGSHKIDAARSAPERMTIGSDDHGRT